MTVTALVQELLALNTPSCVRLVPVAQHILRVAQRRGWHTRGCGTCRRRPSSPQTYGAKHSC